MNWLNLLPELVIFIVLVLASAIFSGSETALFSLRHHHFNRHRRQHPDKVSRLEKIVRQPSEFLSTILVCNNFVNIAASAIATRLCLKLWGENGIFIATFTVTIIILIASEITPKTYAAVRPDQIALRIALPLSWLIRLCLPINRVLALIVNRLLKTLGLPKQSRHSELSDAEIKSVIFSGRRQGLLKESESRIIHNVLDFDKIRARDIMKPRSRIVSLAADAGFAQINDTIRRHNFSRYPVYERNSENIIGILQVKDLLRAPRATPLKKLLRPAIFFPETATLDLLLEEFRRQHVGLAIIVDEYGGIEGLLSRHDVVTEVIGYLADDNDAELPPKLRRQADGSYLAPGSLSLRKLEQMVPEIDFGEDCPATSAASLILEKLGSIPVPGTDLEWNGLRFTVSQVKNNRITKVNIKPLAPAENSNV